MGYTKAFKIYLLFPVALICMILAQGADAAGNGPPSGALSGDVQKWMAELESRAPSVGGHKISVSSPAKTSSAVSRPETGTVTVQDPGKKEVQRISVDFYKIDLHNVFRLLSKISHKNFVVDESVAGTLTMTLQNVPWPFVLEVIKNLKGLSSIERYNTIMIYPSSKKVTWAGDNSDIGSLDLSTPSISETRLKIKGAEEKDATPVEQIVRAQGLIRKASGLEKAGKITEAMDFYKKASDMWPDNISLLRKIASIAMGPGHDELTALNYARKALRNAPRDCEAATLAAVALARMGKNQEARGYFERAMRSGNVSSDSIYNYAVFCFSRGDYRETLRLILRLEKKYSLSPEMLMLRARSYDQLHDRERASREYRALVNAGRSIPVNLRMYAQERLRLLNPTEENHDSVQ